MMIKVLLVCAFVAVMCRAQPPPPSPEIEAAMATCKGKFPSITDDIIRTMHQEGSTTDDNVKCFMLCLGQSTGRVDSNGVLIKDVILNKPHPYMDPTKVQGAIDGCMSNKGATACETAYLQWQCLEKAAKRV